MRRFLSVLILVSFPLTPFYVFAAEEAFAPFLGTWEYRQRNSASPTGYDAEGERIELKKQGGSIQGLYFGLQREGEHGLYYTLVEIKDIEVSEGGKISFRIPERDIYRERPRSLEEIQRVKRKSAGFTRVWSWNSRASSKTVSLCFAVLPTRSNVPKRLWPSARADGNRGLPEKCHAPWR